MFRLTLASDARQAHKPTCGHCRGPRIRHLTRAWTLLGGSVVLLGLIASCGGSGLRRDPALLRVLEEMKRDATRPLSSAATGALQRDGFVIVPAAPAASFHFGYTALFEADQPMYFTADAALHAVHASFDDILIDLEKGSLVQELHAFLDELRRALPQHRDSAPETRREVDLFLAVAKGLLVGEPAAPVAGASSERISELLEAAAQAAGPRAVSLFGRETTVDLSLLKPRGHYTRDRELERYFRSMAWLGRVELRLAEAGSGGQMVLQRGPLAAALVIAETMTPRAEQAFRRIDRATAALIGPPDSMSLLALRKAASTLGLSSKTVESAPAKPVLDMLGTLGQQRIQTQLVTPGQRTLPLWLFGQRYIPTVKCSARRVTGNYVRSE